MEENKILTLKSKVNLGCKICEKCCKNRGDIKLTPINVLQISKFLKISIDEFLNLYTTEVKLEPPEIVLKASGSENFCVLCDNQTYKCKIHKVKPMQCVVFPLVPVDVNKDLFINSNQCPENYSKEVSVNKWINGNNNIYNKNKNIYIAWINLIEEIQPKWKNLSDLQKGKIKKLLFRNYFQNKNFEKQIYKNFIEVRKILYNL